MIGNLGLKPLDDESVALLDDLYNRLTAKRGFCSFCQGGNTCICGGHCSEAEYHDRDCLVVLLDQITWNYRHPREGHSMSLVLTTVEALARYKKRIVELEEKTGDTNYE